MTCLSCRSVLPAPAAGCFTTAMRACASSRASKRARLSAAVPTAGAGAPRTLRSAPSLPAMGTAKACAAGSILRAPSLPSMGDGLTAPPLPGCVWGTPVAGQPLAAQHCFSRPGLMTWQVCTARPLVHGDVHGTRCTLNKTCSCGAHGSHVGRCARVACHCCCLGSASRQHMRQC